VTDPIPHHLEYRSPPLRARPRLIWRTLAVLSLSPTALAKSWIVFNFAGNLASLAEIDRGTAVVRVVIMVILSLTTAADLHLIWAFTRGWSRRTRWVWPGSLFLSLPVNFLLPMCLGFSLSLQLDPLAHADVLKWICEFMMGTGVASAILMVMTCIITDKDRRRQPRRATR
jgi:hypothetical protein